MKKNEYKFYMISLGFYFCQIACIFGISGELLEITFLVSQTREYLALEHQGFYGLEICRPECQKTVDISNAGVRLCHSLAHFGL